MVTVFNLRAFIKAQRIGGQTVGQTADVLKLIASNDSYIPDLNKALALMESIYKADPERNLSEDVSEWVMSTSGYFSSTDVYKGLQVSTRTGRKTISQVLSRLIKAGVLERYSGKDGVFRRLEIDAPVMDWQSADPKNVVHLGFPFQLEKYVKLFPKSIVIVAGGKDAGKTGFLYEFILLNMNLFKVDLYNSEVGMEQMKERFDTFDIPISSPAPFATRERYDMYADIIDPTHISVIDYLDVNSEFYTVGGEIDKIFRKLTTGVAVIAMQKPPPTVTYVRGVKKLVERDLAYGGGVTQKRSALYLSLSLQSARHGRLKIVAAKNRANVRVNPKNMQWSFRIDDVGRFTDIKPYEEEIEDES